MSAQSATPPPQTAASGPSYQVNQTDRMLGGGALALIALAAAAIAMRRRRRLRLEEEEAAQYQYDYAEPVETAAPVAVSEAPQAPRHDPIFEEQPAIVAPSMSALAAANARPRETASGDCGDLESWTERAKCGPTAENPSQSLKKRMKRAAFFEQREREVAAGQAAPVDADAGLPEALDEPERG
jgi:hypothetical protein